jgi:hypothetical protein
VLIARCRTLPDVVDALRLGREQATKISVHDRILQTGLAELTGPNPAPLRKAATIYQAAIDDLTRRAGSPRSTGSASPPSPGAATCPATSEDEANAP